MAIASRAGSSVAQSGAAATTAAVTFNCQTNDAICVHVGIHVTSSSVTSISDSIGNSYAAAQRVAVNNGTAIRSELWWVNSIGANTSNVVTVALGAGSKFAIAAESYSGVLGFGQTATRTGSSTSGVINLTTQDNNNWVVIGVGSQGIGTFASADSTLRQSIATSGGTSASNAGSGIGDLAVVTAGATTNSLALSVSIPWTATGLELRSVSPTVFDEEYDFVLPMFTAQLQFYSAG